MRGWIARAAEIILERLAQGEALGVRGFYYDVLSGMPGAYPLVTPLLASPHPHEIRHGAALLGRLGQPAAIDELVPLMSHRDEGVRVAGVAIQYRIQIGRMYLAICRHEALPYG